MGIFPQHMAKNMVLTYLHFRILKFPLIFKKTGGYNIIINHLWLMVGLKQKSLVGLNHHDLYLSIYEPSPFHLDNYVVYTTETISPDISL